MNARIEKNRKHLASLVAVVTGIVFMLFISQLELVPQHVSKFAIIAWLVIMLVRSVAIESGLRRSLSGFEKKLDQSVSTFSRKHLGIVSSSQFPMGEAATQAKNEEAEKAVGGNGGQGH